jgi:FkbM family methyltransferase
LGSSVQAFVVPHMQEVDFAAHIYRSLTYEPGIDFWLRDRRYDVVIEIGANVGLHTLMFSRMWPDATVYSFEPSRTAYQRLLENLALNECANVLPFNCAVAAESGFLEFHEPEGHLTNGSLDKSFAGIFSSSIHSTRVAAVSGSEIGTLTRAGAKVLLKIDVEGAEPAVVASLERLIATVQPDMLIEVLERSVDALNDMEIFHSYRLLQLGFGEQRERDVFVAGPERDYALIPRAVPANMRAPVRGARTAAKA